MTKDINKLCFLPGSLLPLKDGKYPYISLLKQGLTNLGVTFPTPVPGAPGLTATQIAFGDGSNLMTGSSDLQFTANALTIESRGGYWNANGTGQDIYLRSTGSNYVYLTTGGLVQLGDPLGNGNGNKIEISDAYNLAYYDNTAHAGFFGINTSSPSVALDVVGQININANGFGANVIKSATGTTSLGDVDNSSFIIIDPAGTIDYTTEVLHYFHNGPVRMDYYGAGAATFDASGNITSVSDERLKTNIKPYKTGLKELLLIKPIQYQWNEKSKMETVGTYAGFSAQNVRASIPFGTGENKEGYLSLQDRALLATAINAIQELKAEIEDLKTQLNLK